MVLWLLVAFKCVSVKDGVFALQSGGCGFDARLVPAYRMLTNVHACRVFHLHLMFLVSIGRL